MSSPRLGMAAFFLSFGAALRTGALFAFMPVCDFSCHRHELVVLNHTIMVQISSVEQLPDGSGRKVEPKQLQQTRTFHNLPVCIRACYVQTRVLMANSYLVREALGRKLLHKAVDLLRS